MLKKIAPDQLRVGMFLDRFGGAWLEHPFWRSRFVIRDPGDIARVRGSAVTEIWIDTARGLDVEVPETAMTVAGGGVTVSNDGPAAAGEPAVTAAPPAVARASAPPDMPVTLAQEVERARRICAAAGESVQSMFREARLGKAISMAEAGQVVDEITSSVARNPGALVSLARLKSVDDYTYMHSVAVCALMVAHARQLGFDAAAVREAGMAGLTHDLGKAVIPAEIINKPGKLTEAEFSLVRAHPERGHALLVEGGAASAAMLDVCLHHHEKVDGTGYPHRLAGESISVLARMGAISDVYDAVTSNRAYKAPWEPGEAIRRMATWCNTHFDDSLFRAFVKSVGIYPVGSLVRLASRQLAVVVDQSGESLLLPKVMIVYSLERDIRVMPEPLDLREAPDNKILGIEDPKKWRLENLERLWAA